eukprot:367457_1
MIFVYSMILLHRNKINVKTSMHQNLSNAQITLDHLCSPCYTNHLPDYVAGDSLNFSTESKQSMNEFMEWYLHWWPLHYPPKAPSQSVKGSSVFYGSTGRAQMYLRLYNYTRNETYLPITNDYIQNALS